MRLMALACGLMLAGAVRAGGDEVTLTVVKLPELLKAIESHRGQVVVVDLWADYCIPCKKEFPHLVELHEKYAKRGLVCISVTVDDKDDRDRAHKFLKKQRATFPNFLLDEPGETWGPKLDAGAPPTVFVHGKDGKRVRKFTTETPFTYADVEKVVVSLLDGK